MVTIFKIGNIKERLKLENYAIKPEATLDQAADYERFIGAVRTYISKEKMVHTLLDALDTLLLVYQLDLVA